jgi:23S rRNA (guanine745-N1)-methyltransferase
VYRCPVCAAPLASDERTYRCPSGHSFDVAREGYVNLLAGRAARSRATGDEPATVHARRDVLDAGHFDLLRAALIRRVGRGSVLDVGCGEGFYSRPLEGRDQWVGAIDLSKTAARLAARRAKTIRYAVANAFRLPVLDESIDTLLSVFGPVAGGEFRRVLRGFGQALMVAPGPDHLAQLKQLVFEEVRPHDPSGPGGLDEHLRRVELDRLTYDRTVQQPQLSALLAMTPYAWQVSSRRTRHLAAIDRLQVTLDFLIVSFRA